jgi:hypothetical protein
MHHVFHLSICMYDHLSTCNNSARCEWILMKYYFWGFFISMLKKSGLHQNLTRIMNTLHKAQCTFFFSYLAQIFLEWEMFPTEVVQKIKTHFLCPIKFFFLNEINWKYTVQLGRSHVTIWCMNIACWICKATDTHQ